MSVLLLTNQLFDFEIIKHAIKEDVKYITIYDSPTFYKVNKQPVSHTKMTYFIACLSEYVKHIRSACQIKIVKSLNNLFDKCDFIHFFDPLDHDLEKEITSLKCTVVKHNTPALLISTIDRVNYSSGKSFVFANFYKTFRQRLNIFPKPNGGKWSYDEDNQSSLPKNIDIPTITEIHFPTNRKESLRWLDSFIRNKLKHFGKYQDAMSDKNLILYHAGISPMLNMGLLVPQDVISRIPRDWPPAYRASYEGFLRQLFWREYMAMVYYADIPIKNIFHSNVALPKSWFSEAKEITKIQCIDKKINQAVRYGYLHHIERLMLVGNFMLLAQFKPIDVYTWFMCLFVDAHHWVMHANVYHMLLWSSGRVVTGRPYIASSTYLHRMSEITPEDMNKWDRIYARFVLRNIKTLSHTYLISGHIKKAKQIMKEKNK